MNPQSRAAKRPSEANIDFLLETMASDLHLHAIHIATLAAIVNAATRPGGAALLRSSRHLLGDDAKAMLLALKYGANLGLATALIARLGALYACAADAKVALAAIVAARAGAPTQEKLLAQSAQWRRVAVDTLKAVEMFHETAKSRLNAIYAGDARVVREALQRAADGDPRLIDASGVSRLPQLSQRRQSPRLAVERSCTIHLPGGAVQARVEDLSREGLGIVCAHPLAERQQLKITLDDGTVVEAIVARARGSSYGLSLRQPLPNFSAMMQRAPSPGRDAR